MNRGELMEMLIGREVDRPEALTADLSNEAIEGAIRWYDSKRRLGEKIDKRILAGKLQKGGYAGFGSHREEANGASPSKPKAWWQDANARAAWADTHFPEEPDEAEAAVISLANAKKEITVESVRKTIGWERQEDSDFYGGGEYETKLMPPSGGDKSPWISYTARKS